MATSPAVFGEGVWGDFVWGEDSQPVTTSGPPVRNRSERYPVADTGTLRQRPEYVRAPTRAEGLKMIQQIKALRGQGRGTVPTRPTNSPLMMMRRAV